MQTDDLGLQEVPSGVISTGVSKLIDRQSLPVSLDHHCPTLLPFNSSLSSFICKPWSLDLLTTSPKLFIKASTNMAVNVNQAGFDRRLTRVQELLQDHGLEVSCWCRLAAVGL